MLHMLLVVGQQLRLPAPPLQIAQAKRDHPFHCLLKFLKHNGLKQVMHNVQLHGLLSVVKFIIGAKNDHLQFWIQSRRPRGQLEPIHKGHFDIG